jgi:hypothetical protein
LFFNENDKQRKKDLWVCIIHKAHILINEVGKSVFNRNL